MEITAGSDAVLRAGGRVVDQAKVENVVKLFWASPAEPLFHGDETYYVALLSDRLWVLPYLTSGVGEFLREVAPALADRRALFRAKTAVVPLSWRRRLMGLIPLFPTPGLGVHPLKTLPKMQALRPISAAEIQEKGENENG